MPNHYTPHKDWQRSWTAPQYPGLNSYGDTANYQTTYSDSNAASWQRSTQADGFSPDPTVQATEPYGYYGGSVVSDEPLSYANHENHYAQPGNTEPCHTQAPVSDTERRSRSLTFNQGYSYDQAAGASARASGQYFIHDQSSYAPEHSSAAPRTIDPRLIRTSTTASDESSIGTTDIPLTHWEHLGKTASLTPGHTVQEPTELYVHHDNSTFPNDHLPYADHNNSQTHLETSYADDASTISDTEQQFRLLAIDPTYETHDQPSGASASVPTSGNHFIYDQHSYASYQPYNTPRAMDPNWTRMADDDVPYGAQSIPPVSVGQLPAPQSVEHEVFSEPVPVAGPALSPNPPKSKKNKAKSSQARAILYAKGKMRRCPVCQEDFHSKRSNWDRHVNAHTGRMCFKCEECGTERVTKDQVLMHYIRKHLGVPSHMTPLQGERDVARQYVKEIKPTQVQG